ncbi:TPA: hypothetical protein QCQ76_001817 [Bacillus cereus]|nr:hypothetical protein [Bacillus cereus]
MQKIEVMDRTVLSSLSQMDSVSTKQYYEELSSNIRHANLNELPIEEENVINVISDSKLKSLCYKLTMGLVIILMSSTLTEQEIKDVLNWIGWCLGAAGSVKTLLPTPVQKEVHHHHHYYHNDE